MLLKDYRGVLNFESTPIFVSWRGWMFASPFSKVLSYHEGPAFWVVVVFGRFHVSLPFLNDFLFYFHWFPYIVII